MNNDLTWLSAEVSVYAKSMKATSYNDASIMANKIIERICNIQKSYNPSPGTCSKDKDSK